MSYNGWKNRETWNVALWISNTENLYWFAVAYSKNNPEATYEGFMRDELQAVASATPDGVYWLDEALDYPSLDEFIRELAV